MSADLSDNNEIKDLVSYGTNDEGDDFANIKLTTADFAHLLEEPSTMGPDDESVLF